MLLRERLTSTVSVADLVIPLLAASDIKHENKKLNDNK